MPFRILRREITLMELEAVVASIDIYDIIILYSYNDALMKRVWWDVGQI
jgi:hypothetical protein